MVQWVRVAAVLRPHRSVCCTSCHSYEYHPQLYANATVHSLDVCNVMVALIAILCSLTAARGSYGLEYRRIGSRRTSSRCACAVIHISNLILLFFYHVVARQSHVSDGASAQSGKLARRGRRLNALFITSHKVRAPSALGTGLRWTRPLLVRGYMGIVFPLIHYYTS